MCDWIFQILNPGFPARSMCGPWTSVSITLYVVPAIFIGLIYLSIAAWIKVLQGTTDSKKVARCANWFCATFFFCGMGHLFADVVVFLYGWYPFITLWSWCTFVVGGVTIVRFSSEVGAAIARARNDHVIVEELKHAGPQRIEAIVKQIKEGVEQHGFRANRPTARGN